MNKQIRIEPPVLKIASFELRESGSYQPPFRRPFVTHLEQATLNNLDDAVRDSTRITPTALAGATGDLLNLSDQAEEAVIPGGWKAQRHTFLLQLASVDRSGMLSLNQYVNGYTDKPAFTEDGQLDPSVVFYINSSHIARSYKARAPEGDVRREMPLESVQINTNQAYRNMGEKQQVYSLAPQTVFDHVETLKLREYEGNMVIDARAVVTTRPCRSNRLHNVASMYLADSLDAYLQAVRQSGDESYAYMLNTARATVETYPLQSDPFLHYLAYGVTDKFPSNTFTLEDLQKLDGYVAPEKALPYESRQPHDEAWKWSGTDAETLWAVTLAHAIPAYVASKGIKEFTFVTNNESGKAEHAILEDARSFSGQAIETDGEWALVEAIHREVIDVLSHRGQICYRISVCCDVWGDTSISLALNGGPTRLYVAPTFADALFSPQITNKIEELDALAVDFNELLSRLDTNDNNK